MDVITTHLNADFDALGSMIAAKKLYPEAILVFPGSQEKGLRRFFMESVFYTITFEKMRRIDLKKIRRLILVDIRQKDRIGRFSQIVDSPKVELHIYDHHPPTEQDVHGKVDFYRPYGATVSIMVALLQEKGLDLTPEEATILMLGLYEDTGCLTFSSTTTHDLEAAVYLLKKGADLNTVSNLITPELTQDHVALLSELIHSRKTHNIHGIDISIAEASADGYIGDLAVLVHKLKDMENLNVLLVLARMENRVFLVARSRIPEVDVGEIARFFGGGGHPTAASATIKDLTLIQVRERLFPLLYDHIKDRYSLKKVKDYMSFPVKSLDIDSTVQEAAGMLNRYNINSLPIIKDERVCGIITRQIIEKGAYHGYEKHQVSEFMTADFKSLSPEDSLETAQEMLLSGTQRFIPVTLGERLVGVLTRMDILRSLSRSLPVAYRDSSLADDFTQTSTRSITRLMEENLRAKVVKRLKELGRIAQELGMQVYLVGGVVRDILLRRKNYDIDIVVEGDGIKYAEKISENYKVNIRAHPRFGTAHVSFQDGFRVDIATARLEYYERPAALPNVEWSSLKLDLYRRDFTMNTLAIRLNPGGFGELVDFFGGQKDIKDKVIRVIQNLSFIEDPTRIFRALRFSRRFQFTLGQQTKYLMQNAIRLGLPPKLDSRRLFTELKLILKEENPKPILEMMKEYELLKAIHPKLHLNKRLSAILDRAWEVASWFRLLYLDIEWEEWIFYLLCLFAFVDDKSMEDLQERLEIDSRQALICLKAKSGAEKVLKKMALGSFEGRASTIYRMLEPLPIEVLLYLMTKTTREKSRKAISYFITKLRHIKRSLTGQDLMKLGYAPGPQYKKILEAVLNARIDGLVADKASEKAWVSEHFPL